MDNKPGKDSEAGSTVGLQRERQGLLLLQVPYQLQPVEQ
jgi:hypothetical protein